MAFLKIFIFIVFFVYSAEAYPERIVSLAPNVTETLYYLGAGDRIVGVTEFCKWPDDVNKKERVGGMINPSFEKILALKPDLVIISRDGTPFEVYKRLIDLGVNVYVFHVKSFFELPFELLKLGEYIGRHREAKFLAEYFNLKMNKMKNSFNGQKGLFIIWTEPLTVASESSHIGEIIRFLGLKNIASNSLPYMEINIEEIIRLNPDIIFIGIGHNRNFNHSSIIEKLKQTNAVKKGNVFLISEKIYHLSPRIIEGIEEIANGKNSFNSTRKP